MTWDEAAPASQSSLPYQFQECQLQECQLPWLLDTRLLVYQAPCLQA